MNTNPENCHNTACDRRAAWSSTTGNRPAGRLPHRRMARLLTGLSRSPFGALILAGLLGACSAAYYPPGEKPAFNKAVDLGDGLKMSVLVPRLQGLRQKTPVVLLEPVLFKKEVLHRGEDGGLAAWLNRRGYTVAVVYVEPGAGHLTRLKTAVAAGAGRLVSAVQKGSGQSGFYLGGTSLGGSAVFDLLSALGSDGRKAVSRIFFFGTGFDYDYPKSFYSNDGIAVPAGPLDPAACKGKGLLCRRFSLFDASAGPWLGDLPARPAVPAAALLAGLKIPGLFITGVADGTAPSESVYPVYLEYGGRAAGTLNNPAAPRLLMIAGHSNHMSHNYRHADLFLHESAGEVYSFLHRWLTGRLN